MKERERLLRSDVMFAVIVDILFQYMQSEIYVQNNNVFISMRYSYAYAYAYVYMVRFKEPIHIECINNLKSIISVRYSKWESVYVVCMCV